MFGFLFLGQMEKIRIDRTIRSGDDKIDKYIEDLEDYLLSLGATGTNKLILKLEEVSSSITDDLDMILAGNDGDFVENSKGELVWKSALKILNDSNTSKTFDRVMALYSKIGDIKAVSEAVRDLVPEEKVEGEDDKVAIKSSSPYEEALRIAKKGKKN